jgi:hypothetical protein
MANEGYAAYLKTHADALDDDALEGAQSLAEAANMPLQAAYEALLVEFMSRARSRTPAQLLIADSRAAMWRVRVRLYRKENPAEPEADSDDDLSPDAPGSTVIAGLPAVADHLMALAGGFHKCACGGLDEQTLRHRLKSLRPTLSRRGGNARWRVPYMTADGDWIAVVNIQREAKAHESAE